MIELSDDAIRNIKDAILGYSGGGPAHTYEAESLLNARLVIEEELVNAESVESDPMPTCFACGCEVCACSELEDWQDDMMPTPSLHDA